MALSDNFYQDLFEKEKYWTELAQKGLLNIYYISASDGIKKFYETKKSELEKENSLNLNPILDNFLKAFNEILMKIDALELDYRNGKKIDMLSLINLFLYNQMNNNKDNSNNDNQNLSKIELLELKKQVLTGIRNAYRDEYNNKDSIEYDDFEFSEPEISTKKAA